MARPKKPSMLKEMNGSFDHNPSRRNHNEPTPEKELGGPPDYFTEEMVSAWNYLLENIHEDMAGNTDRPSFELMSVLFCKFRTSAKDGGDLNAVELGRLITLMSQYGMSPSERSKLNVTKKPKANPFASV